jgi:crossover junction endodeoxyribonuclease RuvC
MRITIGIDPGQSGAIAILADGEPIQVFDMPVSARKTSGQEVSATALVIELRAILRRSEGAHVFAAIEQVGAMPGNGGTSMFRFGEGFGIVKGVLSALGIGYTLITPPRWKKWAGLIGADKDASRTLAMQRFPGAVPWLTRKKDDGRADAILLARFAWESEQHAVPASPLTSSANFQEASI